jgi:hypothetical protein
MKCWTGERELISTIAFLLHRLRQREKPLQHILSGSILFMALRSIKRRLEKDSGHDHDEASRVLKNGRLS